MDDAMWRNNTFHARNIRRLAAVCCTNSTFAATSEYLSAHTLSDMLFYVRMNALTGNLKVRVALGVRNVVELLQRTNEQRYLNVVGIIRGPCVDLAANWRSCLIPSLNTCDGIVFTHIDLLGIVQDVLVVSDDRLTVQFLERIDLVYIPSTEPHLPQRTTTSVLSWHDMLASFQPASALVLFSMPAAGRKSRTASSM